MRREPEDGDRPRNKIAILIPSLAAGGAERVTLALAAGLIERGYEVDIVLFRREGDLLALVPRGANLVDLGVDHTFQVLRPLIAYLRRERPMALQVHLWPLTAVAVIAARLVPGTRVVTVDHSAVSRHARSWKARPFLRFVTRPIYSLAHSRVAVSAGVADDLATFAGLPESSIEVIQNPLVLPDRQASNPEIEALWGGATNRIVTAANLKPEKNHALLLSAFAHLRRNQEAKLMFVGDGVMLASLRQQAADLGIADDVIFAGFQLDPAPYVASANVFALSSDFEGLPVVLIEGLALGLSIVSTDCPAGPREILDSGRFGILVPCGDAIALADGLRRALIVSPDKELLRRRAEDLSGDRLIDKHLELLRRPGSEGRPS